MSNAIRAAQARAAEAAESPALQFEPTGDAVRRRVVIGDPQAPLRTFLEILDRHSLLADDGTLAPGVHLTSVGDHFDYGGVKVADAAAADGLHLLAWLAAHDASRTTLIAGNHDLGRVGEMISFDDDTFRRVRERAADVYAKGDAADERAFLSDHPALPTSEIAARDFAAYNVAQRELVSRLLRTKRFRLAVAHDGDRLVCHAGVTTHDVKARDAASIAAELDERFDAAIDAWDGTSPFTIEGFHTPGNANDGEGGGALYHRPAARGDPADFSGPFKRRFDPRWLPVGVVQIVGHIRDEKCRKLLRGFCAPDEEPTDGPLRYLTVAPDGHMQYGFARPATMSGADRTMIFVDGGMGYGGAPRYELLDLDTLGPA